MVDRYTRNIFIIFTCVMLIGLVHTLWTSSGLNSVSTQSSVVRYIGNTEIVNKPLPVAFVDETATHRYSKNDILLANIIRERFNSSDYDQDLLIAQSINKDTKGLIWPTPLAVASIIEIESQYNSQAVSDCGARGLMQISPIWSNQVPPSAYTSIKWNIKYGIHILNSYYNRYDGNKMAAILSYNSGNNAYNKGQAWPTYWWRYKDAKIAFDTLYKESV